MKGQLLDASGKPAKDIVVQLSSENAWFNTLMQEVPPPVRTDADGRFQLERIPAGLSFYIDAGRGPRAHRSKQMKVKSGEVQDIGDVRAR